MRLAGNTEPVKRAGADLTPLVDLEQGRAMTEAVRDRRPVYVDLLPPCNAGGPAGENIQAWLARDEGVAAVKSSPALGARRGGRVSPGAG